MMERRQKAQEAREGELFRLLAENVKDYAIFVIDPQGRVESWNPGAERLLGYREEEIIGQSAEVFFTQEDIEKGVPQREMQQACEEGRGNDDRWHVRKGGSRFWAGGMMTPLWDEGRNLRGFAKIMRDRTEWKQAEEARASQTKESERRQRLYDAALSNTPDLVYVFDLDHRFTYANAGLLAELEAINKVHRCYNSARWRGLNHFIFWFHDTTFECVAESFKLEVYQESMADLLGRVCQRLLS
jgi:PAS domain S-box-containing protein